MTEQRIITRQGKRIVIHTTRQGWSHYYQKAREHGWATSWCGEHMICMDRA